MSASKNNTPFQNKTVQWIDERLPIFTMMKKEYGEFPMPKNCNYWWNFGALSMLMLFLLIATGIFLAMHYVPDSNLAFGRIEHIMRNVNGGWLLRYLHMNAASFFFIVVYIHTFRGIYFGSFKQPRELLWIMGVVILFLMMATAFLGYVLPWGQMSLAGAKVITNMFSAIPLVGESIVTWLWGGYSVDNPTLNRFFVLHYLLPFVIFGVVILHVAALHITGSNNPTGIEPKGPQDTVPFHPYFTSKDIFGASIFLIVFCLVVFYFPNFLGHPDNYIPADPMSTPEHIVPEWYFLPFYAILRAVPDIGIFGVTFIEAKLAGVVAMMAAVAILFLLPWLDKSPVKSANYRPLYRFFFWVLFIDCFALGYIGSQPAEGSWITYGRLGTAYYFAHFLVIMPLLAKYEKTKPLPTSISESVIKKQ